MCICGDVSMTKEIDLIRKYERGECNESVGK